MDNSKFGHLIQFPGDDSWALWRWAVLRSAGFTATKVLEVSDSEVSSSADEMLRMEKITSGHRVVAKDAHQTLDVEDYRQTFNSARIRISHAIRKFLNDDRFLEAIIWQNRSCFHAGISSLLRQPAERLRSRDRQNEDLVVSYLQRYCTKNDTIGFFGPVGWAELSMEVGSLSMKLGKNFLSERNVYFEQWTIEEFAESLVAKNHLRPWCIPLCSPFIYLQGTTLHQAGSDSVSVDTKIALLLHKCDGSYTAADIAGELVCSKKCDFQSINEVYKLLECMRNAGWISWSLGIPFTSNPEKVLRKRLEQVEDVRLRSSSLGALEELESLRDEVEGAAGDSEMLDTALGELNKYFAHFTGKDSVRHTDSDNLGKSLVYEDCRRDIEISVGASLLEKLSPPLSLLLESTRWFSCELASEFRKIFDEVYYKLCDQRNAKHVNFSRFISEIFPIVTGKVVPESISRVTNDFQSKWYNILAISQTESTMSFSSEQLREPVFDAFSTRLEPWKSACHNSFDIMIAAENINAIDEGRYLFVLGELHQCLNNLMQTCFLNEHPTPENLLKAFKADMPSPRVALVPSLKFPSISTRSNIYFASEDDFRMVVSTDAYGIRSDRVLEAENLVVEKINGNLCVRTRDASVRFDLIECLSDVLRTYATHHFQIVPSSTYAPRIMIDKLVISRETWSFSVDEVPFAFIENRAEAFLEARRWIRDHDMPRFVFVTVPVEAKPFYIDFDSPIFVNILARIVRKVERSDYDESDITITEMLPTFDQMWLTDREGNRYSSELRMVVVDRKK